LLADGVQGSAGQNANAATAPGGGASAGFIESLNATPTPQGYRVGPNASPQARQFGLAPGDVIASVNGLDMSRVGNDSQAIARATANGEAQLVVLRGGTRITLTVPVR
jgi:S1-C subfamily serine protease